jgi:radical SAM/Cys-rich protein
MSFSGTVEFVTGDSSPLFRKEGCPMDSIALPFSRSSDFPPIQRRRLETLQVNLGYRCNQKCIHCHVNAGPDRNEMMDGQTADSVIAFLSSSGTKKLDLTGGAPELNPHFRELVVRASGLGVQVTDRCNLSILEEPGQEDLADFLAQNRVEVTASMPCYLQENVNRQRGNGVFDRSIHALQRLNQLGYGREERGLLLNLVYNPLGPFLPPPQKLLEQDYRRELGERYGIVFDNLYTFTNMPINRFGRMLVSSGEFSGYMNLLREAHREDNLDSVMCRSLVSIDWQGYVYDCDFNQMLGLPIRVAGGKRLHLAELGKTEIAGFPIAVWDHCYGCTAGQGSSCGGSLQ